MSTLEKLRTEVGIIQEFLSRPTSERPNELQERGDKLVTYLARLAKISADANYLVRKFREDNILDIASSLKEQKVTANLIEQYIRNVGNEEQHFSEYVEKLIKATFAQYEWIRTKVSLHKTELALNLTS